VITDEFITRREIINQNRGNYQSFKKLIYHFIVSQFTACGTMITVPPLSGHLPSVNIGDSSMFSLGIRMHEPTYRNILPVIVLWRQLSHHLPFQWFSRNNKYIPWDFQGILGWNIFLCFSRILKGITNSVKVALGNTMWQMSIHRNYNG
jgi:hypothetical protein